MLKKLYHAALKRVEGKNGERWLFVISIAEASFFPIPPDVLLIPKILAERAKAWRLAFLTTLGSLIGAAIGYAIGAFLFIEIAEPLLRLYGYEQAYEDMALEFRDNSLWIILTAGLTPIPFKIITIACGAVALPFPLFLLACIPARVPRFYVIAALLYYFGPSIRTFIEKRLTLVFIAGVIIVIGGFFLVPVIL